ncbi:purine-nucleoside phosphorylase [Streptomyces sp. URMC 129]|uniref:purine-nucleoside phosphorylase n=1 Tax=Streptomyces sp. URMC 129 TaxID=3423407 RepID=UPI003F1ABD1E
MPRIARRARRLLPKTAASLAAVLAIGALPQSSAVAGDGPPGREQVEVGVLVITMFDGETAPWLENESLPLTVDIPGAYRPLRCDTGGLCVAQIGMGKSNAGISMEAILGSPELELSDAYFLTAGIGGTPPENGTLGFAAWARWIVDYDLGHHLPPEDVPGVPHGYLPIDNDTSVYRLDEELVTTAYEVTKDVELTDNRESVDNRAQYPGEADDKPYVTVCDTVTGDNWFAGREASERAQYITDLRTGNRGEYCTTQMGDNATAAALDRHGHLDRYLSLRTASDFDQPYPGQSLEDLLAHFPGYGPSVENAYRVGSAMARHLLGRPAADAGSGG